MFGEEQLSSIEKSIPLNSESPPLTEFDGLGSSINRGFTINWVIIVYHSKQQYIVPMVQRVGRGKTALLSHYLLYHIASSSFRSRYVVLAQSEVTQIRQLVVILVSSFVRMFLRVDTRHQVCLIRIWLFAKHKSQPPSTTQGEEFRLT